MKKCIYSAMALLFSLTACQKEIDIIVNDSEKDSQVQESTYRVSKKEAVDELNAFLQEMGIETSHTRSGKVYTIDDIDCVTHSQTTRDMVDNNVVVDTIFYLINFGSETEQEGYAVLSADSRAASIVLAVTERGYISQENFLFDTSTDFNNNDELNDFNFYNAGDDDYYVASTDGENNITPELFQHYVNSLDENGNDYPKGDGFPKLNTDWVYDLSVSPMLTTLWDQHPPFNNDCPIKKGKNAPVGCVAIALGQIMAYHEFPKDDFMIDGVVCRWNDIKAVERLGDVVSGNSYQKAQIAEFLSKIGQDCNMFYTSKWSFATPIAAKRCMMKDFYGYTDVKRHIGYNQLDIFEELQNGNPVFIAAISGLYNGHAWVIDGFKRQSRYVNGVPENRFYVHCNWGWSSGHCNGYYFSGIFDLSAGAIEPDNLTSGTSSSDFDWWFRVVTYDNPNK